MAAAYCEKAIKIILHFFVCGGGRGRAAACIISNRRVRSNFFSALCGRCTMMCVWGVLREFNDRHHRRVEVMENLWDMTKTPRAWPIVHVYGKLRAYSRGRVISFFTKTYYTRRVRARVCRKRWKEKEASFYAAMIYHAGWRAVRDFYRNRPFRTARTHAYNKVYRLICVFSWCEDYFRVYAIAL